MSTYDISFYNEGSKHVLFKTNSLLLKQIQMKKSDIIKASKSHRSILTYLDTLQFIKRRR